MPASGWGSVSPSCASRARSAARRSTPRYEANPGEVWEEAEFWVALSWKIDPDGSLGIRKLFRESVSSRRADHDGRVLRVDVRELGPRSAGGGSEGTLTPLQYMRKYGVFKVSDKAYSRGHERPLTATSWRRRLRADGRRCCETARRRRPRGRRRAGRVQHAVAPARVLLADAGRVGLARARDAALRAGARALARSEARRGRVRSAAELPAADAHPHALAGEVAVRDLARQPAVDLDR